MSKDLQGKEVSIRFQVVETYTVTGTLLESTEAGVTIRRPYRNGRRLEFIEHSRILGMYHDEEKGPKRPGPVRHADKAKNPDLEPDDDFDDEEDETPLDTTDEF